MTVLIVHAHHEPSSFNATLLRTAVAFMNMATVEVSPPSVPMVHLRR